MKTRTHGVLLVAALVVIGAWVPVSRLEGWRRDYGQAEPLVEIVWPLAYEMKRFSEQRDRAPNSLDEISGFSPEYDFSMLRSYPHEFSATGPRRFFLRVNSRFAFVIDEHYSPHWVFPPSVWSAPTNPK